MNPDEKQCPMCGETIKAVAIRCKHCHAEIGKPAPEADFDRGAQKLTAAEFEQKFLEFAYQTTTVINAASTAYALKVPTADAEERLEDMAARDVIIRDVDDEGMVFYRLPGRKPAALVKSPAAPLAQSAPVSAIGPPASPNATAGLLLNLILPGLGSIVAGKTAEGVIQLVLILIGFPLCFVLIGIPICIATWGWALATSIRAMSESQQQQQR